MQDDAEEIDRIVDLTFSALLGRKPDQDALLAYRKGFANGTTFHNLIDDVLGSDEYRSAKRRRTASSHALTATPDLDVADDMSATVTLLTARLVEEGWRPQASAATDVVRDSAGNRRRMHSLRVTLSVLDQL